MGYRRYPCQNVCPTNCIEVQRDGHLQITQDFCLCCEACMFACPIYAIGYNKWYVYSINYKLCVAKENGGYGECKYW